MLRQILGIPGTIIIGAIFSYFVGQHARQVHGHSLFWSMTAYSFLLQALVFIHAAIYNTQKYFDLTGSLTFISISAISSYFNDQPATRQYIAAALVIIWAVRLGTFLFSRMLKHGSDNRFDKIKPNKLRFFNVWLIQGLWVIITMSPLLVLMTKNPNIVSLNPLNVIEIAGIAVWVTGIVFEIVADAQKTAFKDDKANKGKFINTGLWSISRHPNYFGQTLLWFGAAIFAFPSLQGTQQVSLISPVFVYLLLMYVSGVSILQSQGKKRWGNDPAYQNYKRNTPVFFPFIGKTEKDSGKQA